MARTAQIPMIATPVTADEDSGGFRTAHRPAEGVATRPRAASLSSRRSMILMDSVRDFCQLERPQQSDIARFKELFYQLIQSASVADRRSISASLAGNHYIPRTVILFLAMDVLEVAAPVLLFSPLINEADIISLARRSDLEHLKVLARREAITADGARALRHSGGREVAKILAKNRTLLAASAGDETIDMRTGPVAAPPMPTANPKAHEKPAIFKPEPNDPARELVDLASRGGRLGKANPGEAATRQAERPQGPTQETIAASRELLEAHRNGGAEGFVAAAAYRTGVRAAIIRAMVERLDGESLAVLMKGMAVEEIEAMQLFLRLLPQAGRDFAKYKSLKAMYQKLNRDRCKLAMLALSGTRLSPEHTREPKPPSARLMEAAAQRRANLLQQAKSAPRPGERVPPRSFGRASRG
ncbi:MAG: DUF2336 domain-containing protein [Nitratireductor sp.]